MYDVQTLTLYSSFPFSKCMELSARPSIGNSMVTSLPIWKKKKEGKKDQQILLRGLHYQCIKGGLCTCVMKRLGNEGWEGGYHGFGEFKYTVSSLMSSRKNINRLQATNSSVENLTYIIQFFKSSRSVLYQSFRQLICSVQKLDLSVVSLL